MEIEKPKVMIVLGMWDKAEIANGLVKILVESGFDPYVVELPELRKAHYYGKLIETQLELIDPEMKNDVVCIAQSAGAMAVLSWASLYGYQSDDAYFSWNCPSLSDRHFKNTIFLSPLIYFKNQFWIKPLATILSFFFGKQKRIHVSKDCSFSLEWMGSIFHFQKHLERADISKVYSRLGGHVRGFLSSKDDKVDNKQTKRLLPSSIDGILVNNGLNFLDIDLPHNLISNKFLFDLDHILRRDFYPPKLFLSSSILEPGALNNN